MPARSVWEARDGQRHVAKLNRDGFRETAPMIALVDAVRANNTLACSTIDEVLNLFSHSEEKEAYKWKESWSHKEAYERFVYKLDCILVGFFAL